VTLTEGVMMVVRRSIACY